MEKGRAIVKIIGWRGKTELSLVKRNMVSFSGGDWRLLVSANCIFFLKKFSVDMCIVTDTSANWL